MHFEFFYLAMEFRHAYESLPDRKDHPPEWPKYVLFYHAVELVLKAYLIAKGVSEQALRNDYGHNVKKLVDEAVQRGLTLPPVSHKAIADLGEQPQQLGSVKHTVAAHLRIRYPLGGPVYSLEQFHTYMEHLFTAVGTAFGLRV